MQKHLIIYCTTPSREIAEQISKKLIESSTAACCSILPGLTSIYRWESRVESTPEFLMMIKSNQKCFQQIEEIINEIHPYTVPEIIAVPIVEGSKKYLSWIDAETGNANG